MTSPAGGQYEAAFRMAVEAGDYPRAEKALRDYILWFRSGIRSVQEVQEARKTLDWAITQTSERKVRIAEDLMRFKRVFDAYLPPKRTGTWRAIG